MQKLGLVVDSLQIQDIIDPSGYIVALGEPRTAEVKMQARIAQAAANVNGGIEEVSSTPPRRRMSSRPAIRGSR